VFSSLSAAAGTRTVAAILAVTVSTFMVARAAGDDRSTAGCAPKAFQIFPLFCLILVSGFFSQIVIEGAMLG